MDAEIFELEDFAGLREDWDVVKRALPAGWERQASALGAFKLKHGIDSAETLLRVLLIHLSDGCSLRQTAARAKEGGLASVSDVALLKRLRHCGDWFEWMTRQLTKSVQSEAEQLLPGRRLRLVDGTVVREPGLMGATWRLHYAIDLASLRCDEVHVTPQRQGESFRHFEVHAGDVLIGDRGFSRRPGVGYVISQGADALVRLHLRNMPLRTEAGQQFRVLTKLRHLSYGEIGDWTAQMLDDDDQPITVRVCAIKKSEEQTRRSQEKLRKMAAKQQRQPDYQTLQAAGYFIVLTTLMDVPAHTVMELYRLRWQIELSFKRLKSLLELGHLKKNDPVGARAWLQGKVLVAVLIERLIAIGEFFSPWGYLVGHPLGQPLSLARDRTDALHAEPSRQPSTIPA